MIVPMSDGPLGNVPHQDANRATGFRPSDNSAVAKSKVSSSNRATKFPATDRWNESKKHPSMQHYPPRISLRDP